MNALSILSGLVMEDGRAWGDAAAAFQIDDACAVCATDGEPYHFWSRPRGGSKTLDAAGVAISLMLTQAPPGATSYVVAADRDQARLAVDSIAGFVRRTPALRAALLVGANRVTALSTGATLDVLAADAPGAWGLRPWLLVVDEVAQWPTTPGAREVWDAVSTAVAKSKQARMLVCTTAGSPAHWARGILDHAHADPMWCVSEVPGPVPWVDQDRLDEQKRRLPETLYRRLFFNEWLAADDALVDPDDLEACVILDGNLPRQPGRIYKIGLDVGLKNDATAAVVAHNERIKRVVDSHGSEITVANRIVLDRIQVWQGTRDSPVPLVDVEDWLAQAAAEYNQAEVIFDPWQAAGSMQRLRGRGVRVQEFTFTPASVGRMASTLHGLIRDRLLVLPRHERLLDELRGVQLRETSPGTLRIDHAAGKHDDLVVACGLAAQALVTAHALATDLHASYGYDPTPPERLSFAHWTTSGPL